MEITKKKTKTKFENPIKNVAIYARVSTYNSTQLHSLGNQISKLIDVVDKDPSARLYDIYTDISSGRESRKNLERLIEDCKQKKVNYILVKSVSRMYRDVVGLLTLTRELKELGVNIHFENDNLDSISPSGEFSLTLVEAIAQAESDQKSKDIIWGLEKAKNNPHSKYNNRIIYGYIHDDGNELKIDEEEANVIRKIYALYLSGLSEKKIIDALEKEKILSPTGKARWNNQKINGILTDIRYVGKESNKQGNITIIDKLNYPEIIDRETFAKVQLMKNKRSNVVYDKEGNRVRSKKKYSSKSIIND